MTMPLVELHYPDWENHTCQIYPAPKEVLPPKVRAVFQASASEANEAIRKMIAYSKPKQ